ncbi:hypothetical protein JL2886_00409 [Phaeobacter gallaeciensis]|uniref:Tetratricopeptide repeat-like domain-containing protein n=1 Tax=Phaeobacter gallaeciensis TaxID=60890 RepID=A0A1B0ZMK3_9RHOB|nr:MULTISPECIES: hypothetical protein [Phaeobacter]MDF1771236.1 hypothetical protein [Pseudophaeobacter sp. bin_em_oilr2.035]MEE2634241.1 hypothetical protein [Pseudomonadota bacterium]ANP35341.1 hypothetical protein JL2886_00409 [Phaeobacter gallaeciensis]MDE4143834.1 hypothetical protein [Phaeobacter gallaeciensis]MDE4155804.1 hypothetical protein [Phaeobacter gallaeciensis]
MSDTDSFIEEVTEEVRRDRLFLMLKRYGWIGGLAVVVIVGGAAYREYNKAQELAAAQALGDGMIAALAADEPADRAEALAQVAAGSETGAAVAKMMRAGALAEAEDTETAVAVLSEVATDGELPLVYRHIASFKALALQAETLSLEERRLQYEALAQPGAPLSLLASEQLALLDIEAGETEAAIARLQAITADATVSRDLQDRATQVIVALGGKPDAADAPEG